MNPPLFLRPQATILRPVNCSRCAQILRSARKNNQGTRCRERQMRAKNVQKNRGSCVSADFSPRSSDHLPPREPQKNLALPRMLTFQWSRREVGGADIASHICRQLSLLSALDTNFSTLWPPFETLKGHLKSLHQLAALGTSDNA